MKPVYFILACLLLTGCAAQPTTPSQYRIKAVRAEVRQHLTRLRLQRYWDDMREAENRERLAYDR